MIEQELDASIIEVNDKFRGRKMNSKTVYLVKFDRGYYAAKQPNYDWSFTADPSLAKQYKTLKKAQERGEWGIELILNPLQSFTIEEYKIDQLMTLA